MAQLGSVVGGILAELARARVVADRLTRDLVGEYEDDPILSGLSVPRVKLSEATLTVRYVVNEVASAEPVEPDPVVVGSRWQKVARDELVPRALESLGVTGDERRAVSKVIAVKAVGVRTTEQALGGDTAALVDATVEGVLESWNEIPVGVRRRLGGKSAFRSELRTRAATQLESFLARAARDRLLSSVLASKIDVGVLTADLPEDPSRIQEVQLTVTGEDLELVLGEQEE